MFTSQQEPATPRSCPGRSYDAAGHPVELLLQGQQRIRIAAGTMSALADDLWRRGRECYAHAALSFFCDDWALRTDDEARSLMPRLVACAASPEQALRMAATLTENHDRVRESFTVIAEGLHALTRSAIPDAPAAFAVNLICASELLRLHADWEERTFFPWARRRLGRSDAAAVWREMTERRGLVRTG